MRRAGQGRILVVEADGGSRGNPGPAGYGALVRDGAQVLAERAAAIGVATNNVAEYRGLIAGLQAVAEIDPHAEVEVRMDSKLVVEQMSGRWKVKHDKLQPLARQAASLVRGLGRVSFRWVPREQNTGADRLANEAMDAAAEGREWQPSTPAVPDPPVVVDAGAGAGADAGAGPGASSPGPAAPRPGWRMPASPPLTTLLIRHGQTVHSVERRFSGASDPPLTDLGEAQARATARRLAAFASAEPAVVSSPLRR
ncbi:MAG: reverse transcriptase-like protein, partial [Frankiaceae bacterium]